VATDISTAWDRYSAEYQSQAQLPTHVAHYGPDIPTEAELRLLGDLRGKRVLELGCGGAQCSIAFAKQGATAIGIDLSAAQLAYARQLSESEEVRVELRQGDMADLAFLRADSIDLVFSAWAFEFVEDLNRVFRQVHRVLKVGAPLVFSLPHPAYPTEPGRSHFDRSPFVLQKAGVQLKVFHHTFSGLYMGLNRASYRVDLVLEPAPIPAAPRSHLWEDEMEYIPRTLIIRARKEGN
jgi:SAM-dependent methyltransferase